MNNYNIENLIIQSFRKKIKQKNIRDIGKFLQFIAENYVQLWLKEECGIESTSAENDENGNETPWDILTKLLLRLQVKYRGGKGNPTRKYPNGRPKLFLETTRRNSQKNEGAKSESGHVAYGSDEFDIAIFVIPSEDFDFQNTEGLEILAIPAKELVNPKHPEILRKNVPAAIMDRYLGRAKEVILSYEHSQSVHSR
jgi:hypothetical protein